jgi:hypothetical protein
MTPLEYSEYVCKLINQYDNSFERRMRIKDVTNEVSPKLWNAIDIKQHEILDKYTALWKTTLLDCRIKFCDDSNSILKIAQAIGEDSTKPILSEISRIDHQLSELHNKRKDLLKRLNVIKTLSTNTYIDEHIQITDERYQSLMNDTDKFCTKYKPELDSEIEKMILEIKKQHPDCFGASIIRK